MSEQTGVPVEEVPIIHSGGQSRPLYTPRIWDNESSGSDEDGALEGAGPAVVLPKARPLSVVTAEVVRLVPWSAWFQGRASVEWRGLQGLSERRALAATQPPGIIHPWSGVVHPWSVGTSDTPASPVETSETPSEPVVTSETPSAPLPTSVTPSSPVRIPPPPPAPIRRVISAVPTEALSSAPIASPPKVVIRPAAAKFWEAKATKASLSKAASIVVPSKPTSVVGPPPKPVEEFPKKSLPKSKSKVITKPAAVRSSSSAEPKADVIVPSQRVGPSKAPSILVEDDLNLPFEVPVLGTVADSSSSLVESSEVTELPSGPTELIEPPKASAEVSSDSGPPPKAPPFQPFDLTSKSSSSGGAAENPSSIIVIEDEAIELEETGRVQISPFHDSLKVFVVQGGQCRSVDKSSFVRIKQHLLVWDWHQVLDTDRHSRHFAERPTGEGIPPRHIESLNHLRTLAGQAGNTTELIICSHIERSQANLENLLYLTELSNLPVRYILITEQRCGPAGKLAACQALSSGLAFIYNDNPEIVNDFWSAGQVAFQVRKPRAELVAPHQFHDWSCSSAYAIEKAETFIRTFSLAEDPSQAYRVPKAAPGSASR